MSHSFNQKKMIYDNFIWKRKHKLIIDMSNFDRYD